MTVEVRIRAEAEQDLAEAAQQTLALTVDQKAELDHRLDSIELDNNRGLLATDVVVGTRVNAASPAEHLQNPPQ